jgi:hypothetical protein
MYWRLVSSFVAVWRHIIPRRPVTSPTRHEQCLAEIARLERELANDGVLFLKSSDDFDREVAQVTTKRLEQATPAGGLSFVQAAGLVYEITAANPPAPVKNGVCSISGQRLSACACDPRWAQIPWCPKRH